MTTRRILVAEDDPMVGQLIETVARERGYDVDRAGTGNEAVEIAALRPPDAAVVDLHLPGLNGLEVSSKLRDRNPRLPLAVISGAATEVTESAITRRLPGATFLAKPVDWDRLWSAIEGAPAAAARPRLLVVEDHEPVARLVDASVRDSFDIRWHADGNAAVEAASSGEYDLALVDLHVPGPSGPELVRALRAADPGLVVVMITGEADAPEIRHAYDAGAEGLVRKPFSGPALVAYLESQLPSARERRAQVERLRRETPTERWFRRTRAAWKDLCSRENRRQVQAAIGLVAIVLIASLAAWGIDRLGQIAERTPPPATQASGPETRTVPIVIMNQIQQPEDWTGVRRGR